jgi:hypothetical protein
LTNIHGIITIVTNHGGNDMYTFDDAVKPKSSAFYVRQVVGSVNYDCGTDVIDFSHGFLNYQIEHHGTSLLVLVGGMHVLYMLYAVCCVVLYCVGRMHAAVPCTV